MLAFVQGFSLITNVRFYQLKMNNIVKDSSYISTGVW